MNLLSLTGKFPFGVLLLSVALLAGCGGGGRLSGTYSNSRQTQSVRFQGGWAFWSVDAGLRTTTKVLKYAQDGNQIILESPQGNVILTLNKDGSIEGPAGDTLTKR